MSLGPFGGYDRRGASEVGVSIKQKAAGVVFNVPPKDGDLRTRLSGAQAASGRKTPNISANISLNISCNIGRK